MDQVLASFALLLATGCAAKASSSNAPNNACTTPRLHPTLHAVGSNAPSAPTASPQSAAATPSAQDPTVTDGDKYHVALDNDRVRVLRYHDKPGEKTHPHHHVEFVLYALSPFRRRLTFADGSTKERDFKPGDVIWMPDQIHTGENTGTTDTDVIIVENKLAKNALKVAAPPRCPP